MEDISTKAKDPLREAVRRLRIGLGDTQQQFAARLGLAISTVVRYELSRPPRGKALAQLDRVAMEHGLDECAVIFRNALREELGGSSGRDKEKTMSWSFSAIGKSEAVGRKAADELLHPKCPCAEPEESIRQAIGAAIKVACDATPELGLLVDAKSYQSTEVQSYPDKPKVTYYSASFTMHTCSFCE